VGDYYKGGRMKNPCDKCERKEEDEYGLVCDLACGKHSAWFNHQEGIREVVTWLNDNFEPTVPMTLDYKKWHNKLKEWGISNE